MLYCLAQAVLLITMMYAGMSDVLHTGTYIRVISGGGERTKCINWGKFQHTFSECLALLLVVKNEGSYAYGGTRDVLLGDVDGQSAW